VLHARNGKRRAASVASRLKPASSYPGVQLALVVGICGGAPSPLNHQEIFLGNMDNSDMMIELLNTILDGNTLDVICGGRSYFARARSSDL
jgi:hypothetical protein